MMFRVDQQFCITGRMPGVDLANVYKYAFRFCGISPVAKAKKQHKSADLTWSFNSEIKDSHRTWIYPVLQSWIASN